MKQKFFLTLSVGIALVAFTTNAFAVGNPFADVPAGHWSYDAVILLANRGVISGYSGSQYQGEHLATRFEMASIVARALEKIDLEHASQEDLELFKKLAAEYEPELKALGTDVTTIDDKTTELEDGLNGLHLNGNFWHDAEWGGSDNNTTQPRFYHYISNLMLWKQFNENTFFYLRVYYLSIENKGSSLIDRLVFTTKLPGNITGMFGYLVSDWDYEYKLYDAKFAGWGDEDAFWTDLVFLGFNFTKDFGMFNVDTYIGRNFAYIEPVTSTIGEDQAYMVYGLKIGYKSEKLRLGIFGRYAKHDGEGQDSVWLDEANVINYGVYFNYAVLNGLEVKGTYNHQQLQGYEPFYKNADYWQIAVEADQSLLKLFSFWVQYGQVGEYFLHNPYAFHEIGYQTIMFNFDGETGFFISDFSFFKIAIHRNLTKKLEAFLMYERFNNLGKADIDDTVNFGFGVKYQYSPAIAFQLQYDWRDYGKGKNNFVTGKEDMFRFRTIFTF